MWRSCLVPLLLAHFMSLSTAGSDSCTEDPTDKELLAASSDLQAGRMSPEGLEMFRCKAKRNKKDWRAHGMLGQALAQQARARLCLRYRIREPTSRARCPIEGRPLTGGQGARI
jgi:hypothetical protein